MDDDAATLVEAMASEAGACVEGARAAAIAEHLSSEEEPAKIIVPCECA